MMPKFGAPIKPKFKDHPWKGFAVQSGQIVQPAKGLPMTYYGPSELKLRDIVVPEGGPMGFVKAHPELFHTGTTSTDEGFFYWAEERLLGPEGPEGGWYYQSGNADANAAIVDFRVSRSGGLPDLGIRIQSAYRHLGAGPFKAASDAEQIYTIMGNDMIVVDVWSEWYIGDLTGKAVLAVARQANAGDPFSISPVALGGQ
jgi:hypothetical protein